MIPKQQLKALYDGYLFHFIIFLSIIPISTELRSNKVRTIYDYKATPNNRSYKNVDIFRL